MVDLPGHYKRLLFLFSEVPPPLPPRLPNRGHLGQKPNNQNQTDGHSQSELSNQSRSQSELSNRSRSQSELSSNRCSQSELSNRSQYNQQLESSSKTSSNKKSATTFDNWASNRGISCSTPSQLEKQSNR